MEKTETIVADKLRYSDGKEQHIEHFCEFLDTEKSKGRTKNCRTHFIFSAAKVINTMDIQLEMKQTCVY